MSANPPHDWTAAAIASDVRAGRRCATDVCSEALRRVARLNESLGAFLEVHEQPALAAAQRVDASVADGRDPGPLAGVPIAVKDVICTRAGHTTCGSKMLANYRSPFDATAVARLSAAGGIVLGKTNLDEFAMGSSTENSGYRNARNPWDESRVPGGSSGGSAVVVAARMTPVALGTDTGGSVRQPAAFCGIVGLKPTYGRVSRFGLVAYGSSLDQIGPMSANVADAALLLQVIAGADPADSTSAAEPVPDYPAALADAALDAARRSLRLGLPREYFGEGLDPQVRAAVQAAVEVYRALGASVVELSLPYTPHSVAAYYLLATAEASSNLARFDGVHYGRRAAQAGDLVDLYAASRAEGLGAEVKRRIMLGTFALSSGYHDAYYARAQRVRSAIAQDFSRAFEQCDLLVCPTTPTPAFRLGEKLADPLQMYLADVYTTAANLAGIAAISIPCGFSDAGLPIGLQLQGPRFSELRLLQAARLYEQRAGLSQRRPAVCADA